jgi:hypothetical protein
VSEKNPFEIVVELDEETPINKMVIYGDPERNYQPKALELYGGTDKDNLTLITSVPDATLTGNDVVVSFNLTTIKYYKLVVTDTYCNDVQGYIAFRSIKLFVEHPTFTLLSPDNSAMKYYGDWQVVGANAPFGHVYSGGNASAVLRFTGTAFAILKSDDVDFDSLDVTVDGEYVECGDLTTHGNGQLAYIVMGLKPAKHKVKITVMGEANISGIAISYSTDEEVAAAASVADENTPLTINGDSEGFEVGNIGDDVMNNSSQNFDNEAANKIIADNADNHDFTITNNDTTLDIGQDNSTNTSLLNAFNRTEKIVLISATAALSALLIAGTVVFIVLKSKDKKRNKN